MIPNNCVKNDEQDVLITQPWDQVPVYFSVQVELDDSFASSFGHLYLAQPALKEGNQYLFEWWSRIVYV